MTDDPRSKDFRVLDHIEPFEVDGEDISAYNAAVDALHHLIGQLSATRWEETHRDEPDHELLDLIRERTDHYVQVRKQLNLTDPSAVAAVRLEVSRILVAGGMKVELQNRRAVNSGERSRSDSDPASVHGEQ